MDQPSPLSSQRGAIMDAIGRLEEKTEQPAIEKTLKALFRNAPPGLLPDARTFYAVFSSQLHRYLLKHYRQGQKGLCLWRFLKTISPDQLDYGPRKRTPEMGLLDALIRLYLYSEPLDDLTCLFIPVQDRSQIKRYLAWIKRYFYDADYPTSLLWLYALDSSLASLFPDEIVYLGRSIPTDRDNIRIPDFAWSDAVLIKRYSDQAGHYTVLEGQDGNNEFRQLFAFLEKERRDRCLCRSGKKEDYPDGASYRREWEKFEDVLKFGVSDRQESGCISFSDMRASTEFLNTYGKNLYLNKIQQPFFEQTKLISKQYRGRIDKFMGDNVMSVFLEDPFREGAETAARTVIRIFSSIIELCRVLYGLIREAGLEHSRLGLRSGVTYGPQILRSNLGNEIVRDFTVTGETVNLAARLEHISIHELILHNRNYFKNAIQRFGEICDLIAIRGDSRVLNPETRAVVDAYTLYQNIHSNLETLESARFDIRFNGDFYGILRGRLMEKGYPVLNAETARVHGYESFEIDGCTLQFYSAFYNPKGFAAYKTIWVLPVAPDMLERQVIEKIV
jgi:class 3 adenylate cyclase